MVSLDGSHGVEVFDAESTEDFFISEINVADPSSMLSCTGPPPTMSGGSAASGAPPTLSGAPPMMSSAAPAPKPTPWNPGGAPQPPPRPTVPTSTTAAGTTAASELPTDGGSGAAVQSDAPPMLSWMRTPPPPLLSRSPKSLTDVSVTRPFGYSEDVARKGDLEDPIRSKAPKMEDLDLMEERPKTKISAKVSTTGAGPRRELYFGWLEKGGEWVRSYKRRFCVIYEDKSMDYFEEERVKKKGTADLSRMHTVQTHGRVGFRLVCPKRTWRFKAHSQIARTEWCKELAQLTHAKITCESVDGV